MSLINPSRSAAEVNGYICACAQIKSGGPDLTVSVKYQALLFRISPPFGQASTEQKSRIFNCDTVRSAPPDLIWAVVTSAADLGGFIMHGTVSVKKW